MNNENIKRKKEDVERVAENIFANIISHERLAPENNFDAEHFAGLSFQYAEIFYRVKKERNKV